MIQFAALTKSLWRRWMRWIPIRILSSKHRPQISAHLKQGGCAILTSHQPVALASGIHEKTLAL
jgi:hypothetical protein